MLNKETSQQNIKDKNRISVSVQQFYRGGLAEKGRFAALGLRNDTCYVEKYWMH
jgi:hypothetical protein